MNGDVERYAAGAAADRRGEPTDERAVVDRDGGPTDAGMRAFAEFLPDPVIVHRDGVIEYLNPAVLRLLGYEHPAELLGRRVTESIVHPADVPLVLDRIANLERGISGSVPVMEVRLLRRDGSVANFEAKAGRMTLGGRPCNVVVGRDVTKRRRRAERMDALMSIMGGLDRTSGQQLPQALRIAADALQADVAIVSRIVGPDYTVAYCHAPGTEIAPGTAFELGMTYCAVTIQSDSVVAVSDASQSPFRTHPCYTELGIASYIGAPVWAQASRWGTINFSSAGPREAPWSAQDRRLVEALAGWVGRTLEALEADRELRAARDALTLLARVDELTGLANRRTVLGQLQDELLRAARYGRPLAVGLIDIDHFKRINDRLGHLAGDRVLADVGATLREASRETDLVGRYGGEEFLFVLPESSGEQAATAMERLRASIESHVVAGDEPVTATIGVAEAVESDTIESLLARADKALYTAKDHGRNQVLAAG